MKGGEVFGLHVNERNYETKTANLNLQLCIKVLFSYASPVLIIGFVVLFSANKIRRL